MDGSDDAHRVEPDGGSELWHALLSGEHPALTRGRRWWGMLPSDPRCKICNAPFKGAGGVLARLRGRAPGSHNPKICNLCDVVAREHPGGTVIRMTMAFADVRGSTMLSAELSDTEFAALIRRFFAIATEVLTDSYAFIDKLVGDAANGFYIPAFAGDDHADKAVGAFVQLLQRTGHGRAEGPWLPVGAAVHTGEAYFGTVGTSGALSDFTALGEQVNLAARLGSAAGPGELLVTDATLEACRRPVHVSERRTLDLKGISQPVEVNVVVPGRGA